jgi:hypothetical protein
MSLQIKRSKFGEWLRRYIVAETLGTIISLSFAGFTYSSSHSYVLAAAAGLIGEGVGFYGYFVSCELISNSKTYAQLPLLKRLGAVIAKSSTNLIIEFAPAEVIDNVFIRPFLMYYAPKHIHPYALGFLAGKFSADILFYAFAISGYEVKKHLHKKRA